MVNGIPQQVTSGASSFSGCRGLPAPLAGDFQLHLLAERLGEIAHHAREPLHATPKGLMRKASALVETMRRFLTAGRTSDVEGRCDKGAAFWAVPRAWASAAC